MEVRVGFSAKPLKNFQTRLYGNPVLTFVVRAVASVGLNEHQQGYVQHNKELIIFIFYLMV